MMLLRALRRLSTHSPSERSSAVYIESRSRSLQMVSVVRTCETIVIPRSELRGICFLDDLIFGIWPARRLSFGTQLLQRLLRFRGERAMRQDLQILLIVNSRLFGLLQFFEAFSHAKVRQRVIRFVHQSFAVAVQRCPIILLLEI